MLAYAAGVLDGDGYLTIVRDRSYDSAYPYYRIKIGSKQLWPGQGLRFVSGVLGGAIAGPERWKENRPIARWELYQQPAASAIARVHPYLLVKSVQAEVLLLAHEIISDDYRSHPERKPLLEELRIRVMRLNRGTAGKPDSSEVAHVGETNSSNFTHGQRTAYLAGLIDSDGTLKIEKRRVKRMINLHYRIKIGAAQVEPSPAINLLARTFGGTIRVRGNGREGHRPIARWGLFDKAAVPAIERLLPYLVIKAPQARLLLQLRERKARGKLGITEWTHKTRWGRPLKMRKRCYSPEQVREFDQLYQIVKALHADGPPYELPRLDGTGSRPR